MQRKEGGIGGRGEENGQEPSVKVGKDFDEGDAKDAYEKFNHGKCSDFMGYLVLPFSITKAASTKSE